jgi:hypothetical protein
VVTQRDDGATPIASRDDTQITRMPPKTKPSDTPAARTVMKKKEVSVDPTADDAVVVENRPAPRVAPETGRRERVEPDPDDVRVTVEQEAGRHGIHLRRFFHRVFRGDE